MCRARASTHGDGDDDDGGGGGGGDNNVLGLMWPVKIRVCVCV